MPNFVKTLQLKLGTMKMFPFKIVLMTIVASGFLSFFVGRKTTNQPLQSSNNSAVSSENLSKGVAVLELYTSEGCSSCPPADDILRGIVHQENVFALAFHVTYWNRLGWTDSFSQKAFDERQYAYSARFQKDGVYTPQLVVNGTEQFVGSRKTQTENAIKKALAKSSLAQVKLSKTMNNNTLDIHFNLKGDFQNAVLNFALVESNFSTKVIHGENEGRTLKHDNVVRDFQTLNVKNTEGVHKVIISKNWQLTNCSIIAFLQDKTTGQVIGASKMKL